MATTVYLGAGAALSYLVWGPWEGVDPRPFSWWVISLVLAFHVGVGAVIGRWWALSLPLVWAVLSVPADGYDTPVATQIAFQTLVPVGSGSGRRRRGLEAHSAAFLLG